MGLRCTLLQQADHAKFEGEASRQIRSGRLLRSLRTNPRRSAGWSGDGIRQRTILPYLNHFINSANPISSAFTCRSSLQAPKAAPLASSTQVFSWSSDRSSWKGLNLSSLTTEAGMNDGRLG